MRVILHTKRSAENEVFWVLQSILSSELIGPGRYIWLVSPWISDIDILDNRSGAFRTLNPSWGFSWVRLSSVISELATRGTTIHIVTRNDGTAYGDGKAFVDRVLDGLPSDLGESRIHPVFRKELHAKGLLTERSCLMGSMNFTHSGRLRLDENLAYYVNGEEVAEHTLGLRNEYDA